MSQKKEKGINNCFANVFIHGVVSNVLFKDLKNSRSLISLHVCVEGNVEDFKADSLMSNDIEVIINNKKLMQKVKNYITVGSVVIIKGRIVVKCINSNDAIAKKFSYISAKDIIVNNQSHNSDQSHNNDQISEEESNSL